MKCPGSYSLYLGQTVLQISIACGQRVWNLQPFGGLAGEGISPFRTILFILISGLGFGMAENNAFVYGCRGLSKISFFAPYSTIEPRYITPILSEMNFTTDKSWDMNKYVSPIDF